MGLYLRTIPSETLEFNVDKNRRVKLSKKIATTSGHHSNRVVPEYV